MPIIGDIHDVTKAKLKEVSGYEWVDIIAGGDPCQPRSVAGKRRGREDDRDLWKDMFRVICEFKPAWVLNENPTGRLTMDFHEVLSDLESQGYETRSFVIPACAVNAPHRRDRLYIVAHANGKRELQPKGSLKNLREWAFYGIEANTYSDSQCHGIQGGKVDSQGECFLSGDKQLSGFLQFDTEHEVSSARVYRDLHGVSPRMDSRRTAALGNAQVPQQVYPIYKAIVEVESNFTGDIK